jgi:hypothetical protein
LEFLVTLRYLKRLARNIMIIINLKMLKIKKHLLEQVLLFLNIHNYRENHRLSLCFR